MKVFSKKKNQKMEGNKIEKNVTLSTIKKQFSKLKTSNTNSIHRFWWWGSGDIQEEKIHYAIVEKGRVD